MDSEILLSSVDRMKKAVEHTRDEMLHIRTGKASPSLLDSIKVEYYGTLTPLKQVASIAAPEPRLLVLQPFDKNVMHAIEKAILAGGLGLNPQNDGRVVRVPIPMLTAARREELVKVVRKFAEEGRVSIRSIRREANELTKKDEKAGLLSEDDSHKLTDQIQKETDKYIAEIDALLKKREADIREE